MPSIAFAAALLPGKTEVDRAALASVANGERRAEHEASRKRAGITRESVWLQSTPNGDIAVVVPVEGLPQGARRVAQTPTFARRRESATRSAATGAGPAASGHGRGLLRHPARVIEGSPQQHLDVRVEAAELVGGPPGQRVMHRWVEP